MTNTLHISFKKEEARTQNSTKKFQTYLTPHDYIVLLAITHGMDLNISYNLIS